MKNDKGFTLVELLAVVTILGIILVATIPAVNRWIGRGKTESLESQKKTLVMATESYAQSNSKYLPKKIGESIDVPIKNLKDAKYLKEDILNADKKSCMENSYVRIYQYSRTKYKYMAFVYCEGDEVPVEDPVPKPTIEITFSDKKGSTDYSNNVNITSLLINIEGGNIDEEKLGISGYSYTISVNYSYDPAAKEVEIYNSGSLNADGRLALKIEKSLGDYVDITTVNNFTVKVIAYNQAGGYLEKTSKSSYEDTDKPICGDISGQAGENEWNKTWRKKTITIKCSDGDGSGCVKDSYTQTFNTEMNIGYIRITDNAGNYVDCPVRVHLDWTTPTVTINAYKRNANGTAGAKVGTVTANNSNREVTLNSYSGGYGGYSWLNVVSFPYGINYEVVTADNVILNKGTWYENVSGLWLSNSKINDLVEKSSKTFTQSDNKANYAVVDDGFRKAKFVLTDKASNSITINITSPIDKTRPTATASKSNLDTEDGVTVTVNCRDAGSGCQRAKDTYYRVKSTQSYYVLDNAGNQNNNPPTISVSSYDCHPVTYKCGTYVCGSYECCSPSWGTGEMSGQVLCSTCLSYCDTYCTDWKTCYR